MGFITPTFCENFDIGVLREIVGVDLGWIVGVGGSQADGALAAGMEKDGENGEAFF